MKKGIFLKLTSFVVVTALLCMPVLARPRIQFLDDIMDNMPVKDSISLTGSIDIHIGDYQDPDISIPAIIKLEILKNHLTIPMCFEGTSVEYFDYELPWNHQTMDAASKLRKQITTTANYRDKVLKFGDTDVQVVFTKDKHPGASVVTCEVTFS